MIAVDPGPTETALIWWSGNEIRQAFIRPNEEVLSYLVRIPPIDVLLAVEMVACYGMPVGREVFETVLWIGRFQQVWEPRPFRKVYRQEVKLHHCKSARAKDSNVRQALIDKYGAPGVKAKPGLTYPLKSHLWSAFAIATYVTETTETKGVNDGTTGNSNGVIAEFSEGGEFNAGKASV